MVTPRNKHGFPSQRSLEIPLLQATQNRGGTIALAECREQIMDELAKRFRLTSEQQNATTNDGSNNRWWNWMKRVRKRFVLNAQLAGSDQRWRLAPLGRRRLARNANSKT
jgi:hypothetical protein